MRPNDLTVLVTRPDPRGLLLCQYLEEHGIRAVHCPTIAFIDLPISLPISPPDFLIFISPHAVTASTAALKQSWPVLPAHTQVVGVGGGTVDALSQAGFKQVALPESSWNTEGLLAMPMFQALKGKKIVLVKGDGGRVLLEETLKARGAEVILLHAYQRVLPAVSEQEIMTCLTASPLDVILCTSYEGVLNLKQLAGQVGWPLIKDVPLMVMSQRIKLLAEGLGFRTIWVAPIAGNKVTLEALLQKRDELCQMKKTK